MSRTPSWLIRREGEPELSEPGQEWEEELNGKFWFGLPFDRRMYWADWGNHPKIETAAMDGTMRETLVEENIQWPTGETSTQSS